MTVNYIGLPGVNVQSNYLNTDILPEENEVLEEKKFPASGYFQGYFIIW